MFIFLLESLESVFDFHSFSAQTFSTTSSSLQSSLALQTLFIEKLVHGVLLFVLSIQFSFKI